VSVCLDSFALIAWLQDEPAAPIVEGHLKKAKDTEGFSCFVSVINLGEVHYRIWRLRGAVVPDAFWTQAFKGVLPVEPVQATKSRFGFDDPGQIRKLQRPLPFGNGRWVSQGRKRLTWRSGRGPTGP
jgi:hypothetical protein